MSQILELGNYIWNYHEKYKHAWKEEEKWKTCFQKFKNLNSPSNGKIQWPRAKVLTLVMKEEVGLFECPSY